MRNFRLIMPLIVFLSVWAHGGTENIKIDTRTHAVQAPPASGAATYDFDFTGRTVGGIGGGGGAPTTAGYITKTPDGTLTSEFALSALATGLLKNTTSTGVPTIAVAGTDYPKVTYKIYNLKTDFAAKGDGKQLLNAAITTGTATLTSASNPFVSGDVGKRIVVAGGINPQLDLVTTIITYNSAGSVTLGANATNTLTAGKATFGSDDTTTLQTAIDTIISTGSGKLVIPSGIYMMGGALQTTGGIYNAQIKLPNISDTGTAVPPSIIIEGETPSAVDVSFDTTHDKGTILFSTVTGSGIRPCFMGGPQIEGVAFPHQFTAVHLVLQNLAIRTYDDPSISILDLLTLMQVELRNIIVQTDSYLSQGSIPHVPTQPSHADSVGIILPANQNAARSVVKDVEADGFYTGIRWGEAIIGDNITAATCYVGVQFDKGDHASYIGKLLTYGCPFGLNAGAGTTYVHVSQYDTERLGPANGWMQYQYDLYDTNGYVRGDVSFHAVSLAMIGDCTWNETAGAKLIRKCLDNGEMNSGIVGLIPGISPSYVGRFSLFANQNNPTFFETNNTNTGSPAEADFKAVNSTTFTQMGIAGTSNGTYGVNGAGYLYTTAANLVIGVNSGGAGIIRFVNNTFFEVARIGSGLMVGTTTDPGVGLIDAATGYKKGGAEFPVATNGIMTRTAANTYAAVAPGVSGTTARSDGTVWTAHATPYGVVTATVDQTATGETAHVVYTVPANSAAVGSTYRIHAWGNVDNGTTSITFTPRIKWGGVGGTVITATPTFASSTTSNTNRAYVLDAMLIVRTTGATGTAVAEVKYTERSTSTTGVETIHVDNQGTTAVTIDTTANKDLDLTWALSATTGTPHLRTIGGTVEIIN